MNKRYKQYVLGLLISIIFCSTLMAQQTTIDSLFNKGVQNYDNGQYDQALDIMKMLDRIYPNHTLSTASMLMQGKSLYQLKQYDKALDTFRQLQSYFPKSLYMDDAIYGEGTVYFQRGDLIRSVKRFLKVVEDSPDTRLQIKAAKLSSEIMNNSMTISHLRELLDGVITEKSKAVVTLKLAQKEIKATNYLTAKSHLEKYLELFPQSDYDENIRKVLAEAEILSAGEFLLGVILPLTGETSDLGQQLLDGIRFAVKEHNEKETSKIRLLVKDSKGNIVESIKAAQELCNNGEVLAIIGELDSDKTAAIAAVAQERGIPFFAPTASMDGIADIGKYVFQLNSTLSAQAKEIARYAVLEQQKKTFALLYPATEYGKIQRTSFVNTVEELGGEILTEKWYFKGTESWENSIGTQIKAIREEGIRKMIDDSLLVRVSSSSLTDEYADLMDVSGIIGMSQDISDLVDSTALAVTNIDAIYMPVPADVIKYGISHIKNINIPTQLLGSSDYYNLETLEEDRNHLDGVIFPSDFFVDETDYNYFAMRNKFRTSMGKTPGQLEVYGYDVIILIQKLIKGKSLSRDNIRNALSEVKRIPVTHGFIKINESGYNEALHLLRYRNGKFIKVK